MPLFLPPVTLAELGGASLSLSNTFTQSQTINAASFSFLALTVNSSTWALHNRGTYSTPNYRFSISTNFGGSGVDPFTILNANPANVGISNNNPTSLFTVGANLFTVAATSGNTAVAGTLAVGGNSLFSGATNTFTDNSVCFFDNSVAAFYNSSSVSTTNKVAFYDPTNVYYQQRIYSSSSGLVLDCASSSSSGYSTALTITNGGAATFNSLVKFNGGAVVDYGGQLSFYTSNHTTIQHQFYVNASDANALVLASGTIGNSPLVIYGDGTYAQFNSKVEFTGSYSGDGSAILIDGGKCLSFGPGSSPSYSQQLYGDNSTGTLTLKSAGTPSLTVTTGGQVNFPSSNIPTAQTAAAGTNSTALATTAFVAAAISNKASFVGSSGATNTGTGTVMGTFLVFTIGGVTNHGSRTFMLIGSGTATNGATIGVAGGYTPSITIYSASLNTIDIPHSYVGAGWNGLHFSATVNSSGTVTITASDNVSTTFSGAVANWTALLIHYEPTDGILS
jgi:hypothetical protein